jgi:hypothetical protein
MKRLIAFCGSIRSAPVFLALAAALTFVACDNDINFNPTAPTFSDIAVFPNTTSIEEGRSLEIHGSLRTEHGTCLEATILFDGKELAGGRTVCPKETGCAFVELTADTHSTSGHHTISFQVLSQSQEVVDYVAEGRVRMTREGLPFASTMNLDPIRAALRPGESVAFDVTFQNFVN